MAVIEKNKNKNKKPFEIMQEHQTEAQEMPMYLNIWEDLWKIPINI